MCYYVTVHDQCCLLSVIPGILLPFRTQPGILTAQIIKDLSRSLKDEKNQENVIDPLSDVENQWRSFKNRPEECNRHMKKGKCF